MLASQWPLEVPLGIPTEQAALRQVDGVRAWVSAWQGWQGVGTLSWCERRWKALGVQRLPEKLALRGPEDVALWIGNPHGGCVPSLAIRRSLLAGRYWRSSCRDILMSSLTTAMPILVGWQRCWIGSVSIRNRISTHDKFRLPGPTASGWILERASSLTWLRRSRVTRQESATFRRCGLRHSRS